MSRFTKKTARERELELLLRQSSERELQLRQYVDYLEDRCTAMFRLAAALEERLPWDARPRARTTAVPAPEEDGEREANERENRLDATNRRLQRRLRSLEEINRRLKRKLESVGVDPASQCTAYLSTQLSSSLFKNCSRKATRHHGGRNTTKCTGKEFFKYSKMNTIQTRKLCYRKDDRAMRAT